MVTLAVAAEEFTLTFCGENTQFAPVGSPEQLNCTVSLNPVDVASARFTVPLPPKERVRAFLSEVSEKSATGTVIPKLEEEGLNFASPVYWAVKLCPPGLSEPSTEVALPIASRAEVASTVDPSRNLTVPVGIAAEEPAAFTIATNVTGCPTTGAAGVTVSPVLLLAPVTVNESGYVV